MLRCSIAHARPCHHTHNVCHRITTSKWPFHNKTLSDSETLNFSTYTKPLSASLRLLLFGLGPITPRTESAHPSSMCVNPACSALRPPCTGTAQFRKQGLNCFYQPFILILFSLAATVNIDFRCGNIPMPTEPPYIPNIRVL